MGEAKLRKKLGIERGYADSPWRGQSVARLNREKQEWSTLSPSERKLAISNAKRNATSPRNPGEHAGPGTRQRRRRIRERRNRQ